MGRNYEGLYWTSQRYVIFTFGGGKEEKVTESAVAGGERRNWGNSVRLVR